MDTEPRPCPSGLTKAQSISEAETSPRRTNSEAPNGINVQDHIHLPQNPQVTGDEEPELKVMQRTQDDQDLEGGYPPSLHDHGISLKTVTASNFSKSNIDPSPNVDNMNEEESLFVSDQSGSQTVESPSLASMDIPDREDPNSSNAPQALEVKDKIKLEPLARWLVDNSSQHLINTAGGQNQSMQPYNSSSSQNLSEIPSKSELGGIEDNGTAAHTNDREDAGETETVVFAKSKKPKAARKKAGPRAKSAKEWFAKEPKDPREALPEVIGVKRKRSKKDRETKSSRPAKRRRKSSSTKKGKKSPRATKSMKVMTAMFENLRHSNPIEARMALGDMPEESQIVASTKKNQFKQIMQNLPKHVTKRSIRGDKKKLDEATRSFGHGKCVARNGKWQIKGMKTTLYSHQVIGASWMLRREFCQDGPRGGILGDEMGMGKTLQALACIVSNRPTSEDLKTWRPLTLIVAPATSLKQWEGEIRKHAEEKYIGGVFQYRDIKKLPPEVVEGFNGIM